MSVFAKTVTTTLPYWEVKTRETFNYWAVMIDEDCLVGRPHVRVHYIAFAMVVHYMILQMHSENAYFEVLCI